MRRTGAGEVGPTGSWGGPVLGSVFVPRSSVRGNGVKSAIRYLLPCGSSFPTHALRNSPTGLMLPCDPMERPRGCQANEEVWEEVCSLFDQLSCGSRPAGPLGRRTTPQRRGRLVTETVEAEHPQPTDTNGESSLQGVDSQARHWE